MPYFVARGSWYKAVITSQAMTISAGTAMTTTATIFCFSDILRFFEAFFFDMAATDSRSYLGLLLPTHVGFSDKYLFGDQPSRPRQ